MKRFSIKYKYLFLILGFLLFSISDSVVAQKKSKKKKGKKKDSTEMMDSPEAEAVFISAKKLLLIGKEKEAKELFYKIVENNENNDAASFELCRLLKEEGKWDEALGFARKAANVSPENKWYKLEIADLLGQTSNYAEAAEIYEELIKDSPNNPDYYFDRAQLLKLTGDYKGSIGVLNELEQKIGVEESIVVEKQRMYIQLNDVEGAAGEIKKLVDNYPGETRFYHLLAEIYLANGMEDDALNIYKELLDQNPDDPYARLAMAEYHRMNGDLEKGFEEVKVAFQNETLPVEPKIQILLGTMGMPGSETEESKRQSFELAKILSETHTKDANSQAIYGDVLLRNDKKNEAIEAFQKAVSIDGNMIDVWRNLFLIEHEMGKFEDMVSDTKKAIELYPNQSIMYYFNGIANNRLQKYDDAVKSLKQATFIGSDDKNFLSEIYSELGNVHHSAKQFEKSNDAFDKSLELSPSSVYVLNNYSYFLSLRDEELDKAAEMSLKSNELDPNNSSFQDTYGWILYRMQNFDEAEVWLKKSMENGGEKRPVILDHYGDVLWRLDRIDEAVEYWKKAKQFGLDSDVIDRKISDRKVYE